MNLTNKFAVQIIIWRYVLSTVTVTDKMLLENKHRDLILLVNEARSDHRHHQTMNALGCCRRV